MKVKFDCEIYTSVKEVLLFVQIKSGLFLINP